MDPVNAPKVMSTCHDRTVDGGRPLELVPRKISQKKDLVRGLPNTRTVWCLQSRLLDK